MIRVDNGLVWGLSGTHLSLGQCTTRVDKPDYSETIWDRRLSWLVWNCKKTEATFVTHLDNNCLVWDCLGLYLVKTRLVLRRCTIRLGKTRIFCNYLSGSRQYQIIV